MRPTRPISHAHRDRYSGMRVAQSWRHLTLLNKCWTRDDYTGVVSQPTMSSLLFDLNDNDMAFRLLDLDDVIQEGDEAYARDHNVYYALLTWIKIYGHAGKTVREVGWRVRRRHDQDVSR